MSVRLPARLRQWFSFAQAAGEKHGVDPLLIIAVVDRESVGGLALKPPGPQGYGDGGHGFGLMQIDDRSHQVFLGERLPDGSPAWADPARNIDYGTMILRDNLTLFQGDEFLACAAYNAGAHAVQKALLSVNQPATEFSRHKAVESVTAGHNYPSDVLSRRDRFRVALSTPFEDPA